jgi:hypothetical protein
MLMQKSVFSVHGRIAVIAAVAAVALTAVEPSLALAGPAPSGKGLSAKSPTSDATDFSARRRFYRGGGAAAAAAFAGIVGTGLAIAAAQSGPYHGYGGPVYYGADPYYYGSGPYLLRRIRLWRRALLPGPSLSQLVTASWCEPLIRRSLWLADFCLLGLAVNTLGTALD